MHRIHALSKRRPNASQEYSKANQQHIGAPFVCRHLGSERIPDVLVTRDYPERRSDRKIVKDF